MSPSPVRVMSYNVRYFGHALKGLASTLTSKRGIARGIATLWPPPDIICLQEVETRSMRSRWGHRPGGRSDETQLESFMIELQAAFAERGAVSPYEAFYFRAHAYKFRDFHVYTTGLAILVDTRRIQIEAHNVAAPEHITHHHVARIKDTKQTRICAHMKVAVDGTPFHIFNTHLSLPTPFARTFWTQREKMGFGPNQLHEAKRLARFIQKHAGREPFVVCGDFNSPPGSPVYRYLMDEAGFSCAQAELGLGDGLFPTAGFLSLRMHLDHLFGGCGVSWVDLRDTCCFGDPSGSFDGLSDHVPLIARLRLPSRVPSPKEPGPSATTSQVR